ncbi:MAG: hypothetical protein RMJ59_02565 [Candidatus Nitrosocaldus sp.]|nr:hypothetical protein [Candidatus Nitrosocaldus sp.]MDW8275251.1 hypothetical protein [Candidatus Nitrosocaldus sp.]
MTLEALASYNIKKHQLLEEYRRFNRLKASDIAELAEELELVGYPVDRIVDKLLRDLGEEISKAVILKALPEKYLRSKGNCANMMDGSYHMEGYCSRHGMEIGGDGVHSNRMIEYGDDDGSHGGNDSEILLAVTDAQITVEDMLSMVKDLVSKLRNNPALLRQLGQEDIRSHVASMNESIRSIRATLDEIRSSKDLDMRAYIRELQELCIHLLSLSYSYRHIAKVFGISAKWVSKIVRERSIEHLPSVYIKIDRDVRAGEEIDILPYAIALYKRKRQEE